MVGYSASAIPNPADEVTRSGPEAEPKSQAPHAELNRKLAKMTKAADAFDRMGK